MQDFNEKIPFRSNDASSQASLTALRSFQVASRFQISLTKDIQISIKLVLTIIIIIIIPELSPKSDRSNT